MWTGKASDEIVLIPRGYGQRRGRQTTYFSVANHLDTMTPTTALLAHLRCSQRCDQLVVEFLDAPDDDTAKALRRQDLRDRATHKFERAPHLLAVRMHGPLPSWAHSSRLFRLLWTLVCSHCADTFDGTCGVFSDKFTLLRTHPIV